MDDMLIEVEVAYALADKQKINKLRVPIGTTARQVAMQSGLDKVFAGLDLANSPLGIFSKSLARPEEEEVKAGDRVEIYRPLLADPKEARKKRAEKAAAAKADKDAKD